MKHLVMPSQTVGPFPHEAWRWTTELNATPAAKDEKPLVLAGLVFDGAGEPVSDAWLEFWSPNAAKAEGERLIPGFRRVPSGPDGGFRIELSPPSALVESPIYVTFFSRGLLVHLYTAVFLEDAPGLQRSALLQQVPADRRATLLARRRADGAYSWNVQLQGEQETVFFDYS